MAEYFPQGKKRVFPYKVVVPCAREALYVQDTPPGTKLEELVGYVDGEELGGRYKYGPILPAPRGARQYNYTVSFFFTDDKAALAFKMRFG